jgi:poly(3-hydroxybutyrate) depolymerase
MRKRKLFAFFTLAFLLLFFGKGFAKDDIAKNELTSEGKKRSYYLFIPKSVTKDKTTPLLVLLHGSGRNGRILIEHWQKLAEKEGIILAGPDAQDSASWSIPKDGPEFIYNLVEELKSKHAVDSRRVYLFGHSAGAVFGLFMSVLESNYFAAGAVSAGALKKANYTFLDEAERKIPIALFVGTKDPLFPVAEVRKTRDAFAERKFTVELTEVPNLDHNYYSKSSEINEKAWSFLKKYQLDNNQKYKQYQFKSQ